MTRFAILSCMLVLHPCAGEAAPLSIVQGSQRNVVSVIQERSSILSIDRNRTASNGRTTVTEIVQIGPDPASVQIRQNGTVNWSRVFQQGRNTMLDLQQDGSFNRAVTIQRNLMP